MADPRSNASSDVDLSDDDIRGDRSTDSGVSDTAPSPTREISTANVNRLGTITAKCTICEEARSEYLCHQCGRLSYCLKCTISLHDNKYLGTHRLFSLDQGVDLSLHQVKAALEATSPPPPAIAVPQIPLLPVRAVQLAEPNLRDPAQLDLVTLTADRKIIGHRLEELQACGSLMRKLQLELAQEKEASHDVVLTACDAVRRKFDIVRQLLKEKENDFIAHIEEAGRRRVDLATKFLVDATTIIGEIDGYVSHTADALKKAEGNPKWLNEHRQELLHSSQGK
jgi:hypothetical protein